MTPLRSFVSHTGWAGSLFQEDPLANGEADKRTASLKPMDLFLQPSFAGEPASLPINQKKFAAIFRENNSLIMKTDLPTFPVTRK